MGGIFEKVKPFRLPLCIIAGLLIVYIIIGVIIPGINESNAKKTPIVSISGTNKNVYNIDDEISAEDFVVKAKHENGKTSTIDSDDFTISTKSVYPVGNVTTVKIKLKDNPEMCCDVNVKSEREKIMGFQCGYPDVKSVIAVLYSNGELCFEGEGDTLVFDEGEYPWLDYEESDRVPIRAVSFQESVKPTNMNYWFSGLETLTFVSSIPDSVKTMVRTFEECVSMETMADMSKCSVLLNMTETYKDCTLLKNTAPIPGSVTTAVATFEGCVELQTTPDMSNAINLHNASGMYRGCKKLTGILMAPDVKDLSDMFRDCINLKDMPQIPEYAENMNGTFYGDVSLINLTSIPAKVSDTSNCFEGCEMITGNLVINANPEFFSNMFSDSALATKINLTGTSQLLDAFANTSDNGNILVNNRAANVNVKSYYDIFDR